MVFQDTSTTVVWTDDKLRLVFDKERGGSLVDWRVLPLAPLYNPLANKSGVFISGAPVGVADGTGLGMAQESEANPVVRFMTRDAAGNYALAGMDAANSVQFEGDLRWMYDPNQIGPFHYWSTWTIAGGFLRQKITLLAQPPAYGRSFYALNIGVGLDSFWNVAAFPARQIWRGLSRDWRRQDLGPDPQNAIEAAPQWGSLDMFYKLFEIGRAHV